MSILRELNEGPGYLRAGIYGWQASGKTRTAVEIAIGVRDYFGLQKPLGFFDTEAGSGYVRDLIKAKTGRPPVGMKSRSFADLMDFSHACVGQISVGIIDSATHVYREIAESYLRAENARLKQMCEAQRRPFVEKVTLDKSDWGPIKSLWSRWIEWYLNAPVHLIVCGRAGHEYLDREDDEGNLESVRVGTKMRTESEFAYEHALLIEMERVQRTEGGIRRVYHRATVLKDKFDDCLDGWQAEDPDFSFFRPHVARLRPEAHVPTDASIKTDLVVGGDSGWHREKKARAIVSEEIDGELQRAHPGQSVAEKQARRELLERVFGTCSWTAISESTHSDRLRRGLAELRAILRPAPSICAGADDIPDFSDTRADPDCGTAEPALAAARGRGTKSARTLSNGAVSNPPDPSPAQPAAAATALPLAQEVAAAAPVGEISTGLARPSPTPGDAILVHPLDGRPAVSVVAQDGDTVETLAARVADALGTAPADDDGPRSVAGPVKRNGRGGRRRRTTEASPPAGDRLPGGLVPGQRVPPDAAPDASPPQRTPEEQEIHEIEMTLADIERHPADKERAGWMEEVEGRIRQLPDGLPKAKVWHRLVDLRQELAMERARAEAAARAQERQP